MLKIKRVYKEPSDEDGYRILVDRLWPRGLSKEKAKVDYWAREISPSSEIRKFFNHDKEKFDDFKIDYLYELNTNKDSKGFLDLLREKLLLGNVSLIYAAKDEKINHVIILKEWIEKSL